MTRVTLTNFRNYESQRLDLGDGPVVLIGANGAGKTNLLEAVSLLVPGRGIRGAKLPEAARADGDGAWAVAGRVEGPGGAVDLGTGYVPPEAPGGGERRLVRVDGSYVTNQNALAEHLSVHWLTPQMDRIFIDGPSGRRRFFDRLIYAWDPAHAGRVSAYEKALRERLKLLRGEGRPDTAWLSAIEDTIAARGVAVAAARLELLARLAPAARTPAGPFPGALLALDGEVEGWLEQGPALAAEERFRDRLAADRRRDAELGRTEGGPHRTDFLVRHGAKDIAAEQCSTGEQKALLIAIVLANTLSRAREDGGIPVLLLDEVAAHLDESRRAALFERILDLGAQAWMTGTDRGLFEPLGDTARVFSVADGAVA